MEKKKDYNYLIELFFEWNKKNHFSIDIQISEIRILDSEDEVFVFFKDTDINEYNKAIQWLEEQLQPTYEDALQFIIDNEDKNSNSIIVFNTCRKEWEEFFYDSDKIIETPRDSKEFEKIKCAFEIAKAYQLRLKLMTK